MDITPKIMQYTRELAAPERHLIAAMMRQAGSIHNKRDRHRVTENIAALAASYARSSHRRARGKALDSEKRTLVGARLKREEAERYKDIAQQTGRSLYAFVRDALQAEAARCTEAQDIEWVPIAGTICECKTRAFK